MKLDSNTTLLVIATLIVAAGAYWYFFTGTGNELPLSTTATTENQAQTQFETLVGKLQPITFDIAIFADPHFMALSDLATPVTPEPGGRLDPFAAIK